MTRPPTAARTERPRIPALMVNAQSAPGTTMSSRATAQNASTEWAATLPSLDAMDGKVSPIGPKVFRIIATIAGRSGRIFVMDKIDRKILALLQEDGRLTITDLAARVGLSV